MRISTKTIYEMGSARISDLQELEIGPHVIQLHREIFSLHLDFEDLPQIANCLVPAEREERDFLLGIVSRGKERKALDVVPVKVRERDHDLFLLVADGAEVLPQISKSRARVNDRNAVGIEKKAVLLGMGNKFELWSELAHIAQIRQSITDEDLSDDMLDLRL